MKAKKKSSCISFALFAGFALVFLGFFIMPMNRLKAEDPELYFDVYPSGNGGVLYVFYGTSSIPAVDVSSISFVIESSDGITLDEPNVEGSWLCADAGCNMGTQDLGSNRVRVTIETSDHSEESGYGVVATIGYVGIIDNIDARMGGLPFQLGELVVNGQSLIKMHPNPVRSGAHVAVELIGISREASITVRNSQGEAVATPVVNGMEIQYLDTSQLIPGFYFIEVVWPTGRRVEKLLVL
jgi:hypothetical protein